MANTAFSFNTPFQEQLDFFRKKINLPSERWDDITKAAHDKAFIVAGAANADLLQDLRNAIDKAIEQGKGLEWFRKEFKSIVAKRGWTNYTGSGSKEGIAWRTKVIYQTNMSTSYAAGRYKQLTNPDYIKLRPNWKYIHSDSVQHPRPLHQSWDGTVLPHDHPFWKTHFAPNGWGCQCRIEPARGGESIKPPPQGWDKINPKTGAPVGIDKGFDYAFGASVKKPLQSFIDDKLIKLDGEIGALLGQILAPILAAERQLAWAEKLAILAEDITLRGGYTVMGSIKPSTLEWLETNNKPMPLSAEIAVPDYLPFGTKSVRHVGKKDALTLEEWAQLPNYIDRPEAIYYDNDNDTLIFVVDAGGDLTTKMAIEFDPRKIKKTDYNLILTAFKVPADSIQSMLKAGRESKTKGWELVETFGRR